MSTRAQQFRAEAQGRHEGAKRHRVRTERTKPGIAPSDRSRNRQHAARKATYALEEVPTGRPSRKSTRKSANRSKPDTNFNLREQRQKSSPTARFRKAPARTR